MASIDLQLLLDGSREAISKTPVNVASVPHRSPFRYPGGKTWFVPTARRWERSWPAKVDILLEPFAGGAIVGLSALFEGYCSKLILSETDQNVHAVWKTILSPQCEWLCNQILSFVVTEERVRSILAEKPKSCRAVAFQTIIRNRMQHGGIMAPGASLIRSGECGKGLLSRWYPETLVRRMRAINHISASIQLSDTDGLELLRLHRENCQVAAFVDPPYTASKKSAGNRLYSKHQLDHAQLFEVCAKFCGPLAMTYDDAQEIKDLADHYGLNHGKIAMQNRRNKVMNELVIGNDLNWLL